MACLERGRLALAAVADVIRVADGPALPGTILAVRSLPDPTACGDIAALLASVAPPPPELAARAAAVSATLERALVEIGAGRIVEARDHSAAAVAGARALGYQPLLARALLAEGRAAMSFDDRTRAGPALGEAMKVGIEAGNDALGVEAWARRAWAMRTGGEDPAAAIAGLDVVEPLAARDRSPSFARALLENNLGSIAFSHGHREEARFRFERALADARGVTGPNAVEMVNVRGNAATVIDDPRQRDAALAEAESALAHLVGADHPETLRLRVRRAMVLPELAGARDLLRSACDAYERFHHVLAAASAIECWSELGYIAEELGDQAEALAAMTRAAGLPEERPALPVEASGYLALWQGDARAASERFAGAMIGRQANEAWWTTFERGKFGVGLGRARLRAGDPRGARAALEQAVADLVQIAREHPTAVVDRRLARGRAELAKAMMATGELGARIAETARAAAALLRSEGGRADEIAELERAAGDR
jgi:tetratricopeptide (TPR) repeat protein